MNDIYIPACFTDKLETDLSFECTTSITDDSVTACDYRGQAQEILYKLHRFEKGLSVSRPYQNNHYHGRDATIYFVGSGINKKHQALISANITDFHSLFDTFSDSVGAGTAEVSLIASNTGVARNAEIKNVKLVDSFSGTVSATDVQEAFKSIYTNHIMNGGATRIVCITLDIENHITLTECLDAMCDAGLIVIGGYPITHAIGEVSGDRAIEVAGKGTYDLVNARGPGLVASFSSAIYAQYCEAWPYIDTDMMREFVPNQGIVAGKLLAQTDEKLQDVKCLVMPEKQSQPLTTLREGCIGRVMQGETRRFNLRINKDATEVQFQDGWFDPPPWVSLEGSELVVSPTVAPGLYIFVVEGIVDNEYTWCEFLIEVTDGTERFTYSEDILKAENVLMGTVVNKYEGSGGYSKLVIGYSINTFV